MIENSLTNPARNFADVGLTNDFAGMSIARMPLGAICSRKAFHKNNSAAWSFPIGDVGFFAIQVSAGADSNFAIDCQGGFPSMHPIFGIGNELVRAKKSWAKRFSPTKLGNSFF